MRKVVVAAEAAGFDSIASTEHPTASQKWIAGGGHESFDPLTTGTAGCFLSPQLRWQ
jgi:alkanesulfonate monooxygenase SsuD/methylene tetrahydromethanopterin reductase-like flavin-dependent oxidoreductase (luciferase family)